MLSAEGVPTVHVYDRDYVPPAPTAVRALRVLLLLGAGLALLTVGGYAASTTEPFAVVLGQATWTLVPAAIAFVVARRLSRPTRRLHRWATAAAVLWTVGAVASMGVGDPRGLTQLALPVALLVLLRRPSTLDYVDRVASAQPPAPQRRRSPLARLGAGAAAADSGQGTLEYVGVLAAAVLVVAVAGASVQAQQPAVSEKVDELVCSFGSGPGCDGGGGTADGTDGQDGQDGEDGGEDGDGRDEDREACEGLLGCAWEVVKQVGSGAFNVVKGAWDDLVGIWELIQDPGKLLDAIAYLIENPTELWKLIWDDETAAMWASGDYGGAIGRLIWNVGSFFIPGVNLGKLAAKGGRFGTLADLAGELAGARKLAHDAGEAADTAADAARRGDVDAASEAAREAREAADEAAEAARRRGCPVAAGPLSGSGVLALGGADRPVHAVAAVGAVLTASRVLAGGDCGDLTDAAREADEAADRAEGALALSDEAAGDALTGMRNDGGHAIRHLRDEGLIPNRGSLASQVEQFSTLTRPILTAPSSTFSWRLGGTQSVGYVGKAPDGTDVVVFVATEGPYKGKVISAVVPDANQRTQWGIP